MTEATDLPDDFRPAQRRFFIATIAAVFAGALFAGWIWLNSAPPFSQQQYDDGYLEAFRMNMTGPGRMDYKSEFWSMQQGFDAAISDFNKIYQHPDVDPFSYSKTERFRDVLSRIESTELLDRAKKDSILKQLRLDLEGWESSGESDSGG